LVEAYVRYLVAQVVEDERYALIVRHHRVTTERRWVRVRVRVRVRVGVTVRVRVKL